MGKSSKPSESCAIQGITLLSQLRGFLTLSRIAISLRGLTERSLVYLIKGYLFFHSTTRTDYLAQYAKPNCDRWIWATAYTNAWPSQISMVANHILSVGCEDLNLCRKPRKLSSQQQPAKIIAAHCPGWARTTDRHLSTLFPTELQGNRPIYVCKDYAGLINVGHSPTM